MTITPGDLCLLGFALLLGLVLVLDNLIKRGKGTAVIEWAVKNSAARGDKPAARDFIRQGAALGLLHQQAVDSLLDKYQLLETTTGSPVQDGPHE